MIDPGPDHRLLAPAERIQPDDEWHVPPPDVDEPWFVEEEAQCWGRTVQQERDRIGTEIEYRRRVVPGLHLVPTHAGRPSAAARAVGRARRR